MRRIKQRLISAVAALSLLVTAIPALPVRGADVLSTNVNEPFYSSLNFTLPNDTTAQSDSYRIPALVTLSNGDLLAAADIRWNTTYDGGGLDTITARSSDGGVTWKYTVANYLGDNGNEYNGSESTCFIDPCLVVNRDTVYMLVDLYPYGVALNGDNPTPPTTETGFNADGHLLLSNNKHQSYDYYLNLNDYFIYESDGDPTGIQVDKYFNYTTNTASASYNLTRPAATTEPTEETTAPTVETTEPTEETTAPTEETTVPTEETTAPTEETTAPTEETTVPTEETTAPTEETTAPTEETTAPTEETTVPTEESTDPTEEGDATLWSSFWDALAIKASAAEYEPVSPVAAESYNLFFENSPYKVHRTGYLYLTKSTDNGVTWSAPKLLNMKMKDEQVCLVGPGRGITTSKGLMVIPVYSYHNGNQYMGFLSSTDGVNWTRVHSSFNNPSWSSESAVVELSNGDLRFFFRNGTAQLYYVDYTIGTGWHTPQSTGIATNSNTQISAISHSQTLNGKQVILVSCPAGSPSEGSASSSAKDRTNGRIFVFTYDGDNMTHSRTINVNDGQFMYSCLTERSDGSVAILYENRETDWGTTAGSNVCKYEMDMAAYTAEQLGLTSGGAEDDTTDPTATETVYLTVGQTKQATTVIADNVGTQGTYTTAGGTAQYVVTHTTGGSHPDSTANKGTNSSYNGEIVNLHEALYTFTGDNTNGFSIQSVQNSSIYLGNLESNNDTVGIPGTSSNSQKQVFVKSNYITYGSNAFDIKKADENRYLYFHRNRDNAYSFDKQGSSAKETAFLIYAPIDGNHTDSTELPGYYQITSVDQIQSGVQYLIVAKCNSNYYVLYPSTSTNRYEHVVKATGKAVDCIEQNPQTTVTFTGLKPGTTSVTLGDTTFRVIVSAQEKAITKHLLFGTSDNLDALADLGLTGSDYYVTYEVTSGSTVSVVATDGRITAGNNIGTTVITATVQKDNVTFGTVTYTINVNVVNVTDTKNIYVPVGGTATVSGLSGEIITSILDTEYATVSQTSGTTNGSITITGKSVGQTAMVVGTVQFNIFVVNKATDQNSKYLYISVEEMEHCDVYYTINGTAVWPVEGTGVLVNQTYNGGFHLMFFAAPHEGYALVEMSAQEQTDNATTWEPMTDFYTLSNGKLTDGSDSDAFPFVNANVPNDYSIPSSGHDDWKTFPKPNNQKSGHGFRWALIEGNITIAQMRNAFTTALAYGCDGATNITKNATPKAFKAKFTFRAEKLPEFSKEIIGYKRGSGTPSEADIANGTLTGYTDYYVYDNDVTLEFDDTLLYRFTVTSTSENIQYSNITLSDSKIPDFNPDIYDGHYNTPGTYTYFATYTIDTTKASEYIGGKFVNNAQLSYTYKSTFSSGSYGGVISSEAICDIAGIVSYAWEEGTPEAIVNNENGDYNLPESVTVYRYTDFTISAYTGQTTYTETVDGIPVNWTYSGEWGVQRYGETEKTWFIVNNALDKPFQMQHARSLTFYGRWLAEFSVVYKWSTDDHPDIAPPEIHSYQQGQTYTVDNTFPVGYTYNDGTNTWTFLGWKLSGSDEVMNGKTQTIGAAHVYYTGSWTKVANASSLTISKEGSDAIDENQSFLFNISGNGLNLDVVIHGNSSVTIDGLMVGNTYTVTEKTSWSWRYTPTNNSQTVTISATGNSLTFTNTRSKPRWLSGGAWCDNRFTGTN